MLATEGVLAPRDTFALDQSSVTAVVTAMIGFAALAWLALRPIPAPEHASVSAPAAVFAGARAEGDMRLLALAARSGAVDARAIAREHIILRLRAMGLEPEVQSATAAAVTRLATGESQVQTGLVHNIVVRKEGAAFDRAKRPALLVAAHYDSAPDNVDAPDPAASVAAMLETLRALGHVAPLANDVIFLFADGEHIGSLGARAFAQQHRWARQVGLVLQFDATGNDGPLLMSGARGGNGKLIAEWASAAPQAQGSSAFALLANTAPGLRQGTPLDALGAAGMRFATIEGGPADPHELKLPDPLKAASGEAFVIAAGVTAQKSSLSDSAIQQTGDTMLALTRHFGDMPLARIAAPDHIHFDLPLVGQVHYSTEHVWPLTRLVCLMVAIACCIAVKRSGVPAGTLVKGAMAFSAMAVLLTLVATMLWSGVAQFSGSAVRDAWVLLAFIALALAVFIECQRLLRKVIGAAAVMLGALLVMMVLLLAASWLLPGASYLLAWPMTGALLAYAAVQAPPVAAGPSSLRLAILAVGSVPAIVLFAPLLHQMNTLFTFQRSLLLVLTLALVLGLISAPLAALRRRFVAPLLLFVCATSMAVADRATSEPQASVAAPVTYLKDATSWKSWWLLPARPNALGKDMHHGLDDGLGMSVSAHLVAQAPPSNVHFPELRALRDDVHGGKRKVVFTVRSKNNAPTIEVRVRGTPTLRATLDDAVLTTRPANAWSATLHGTAGQLHRFELELVAGNTARIFVQERQPGLPTGARSGVTIASDMLVFR